MPSPRRRSKSLRGLDRPEPAAELAAGIDWPAYAWPWSVYMLRMAVRHWAGGRSEAAVAAVEHARHNEAEMARRHPEGAETYLGPREYSRKMSALSGSDR